MQNQKLPCSREKQENQELFLESMPKHTVLLYKAEKSYKNLTLITIANNCGSEVHQLQAPIH
jgi:hypothetical protein